MVIGLFEEEVFELSSSCFLLSLFCYAIEDLKQSKIKKNQLIVWERLVLEIYSRFLRYKSIKNLFATQ